MLPPSTNSVSGDSAMSNSFAAVSAAISLRRPWPTLTASLSPPSSLSSALSRLQTNTKHFLINYVLIIFSSSAMFLLFSDPFALIVYVILVLAWAVCVFFRSDPMVVCGRHVEDWTVAMGLGIGSVVVVWFVGRVNLVLMGCLVGVLVSGCHAVFRDTEGLFLDEEDAVANGLIASGSIASGSREKGFPV